MNDNKQKVTETLGQAARRLLAELDARKKVAPAYSGTRIQQSPKECPSSLGEEEGRESAYNGEAALHPGPQLPVSQAGETAADARGGGPASASGQRGEEDTRRRLVVAKSDGRISTRVVSRFMNCNDNRPSNREDVAVDRTREVYTLPAVIR